MVFASEQALEVGMQEQLLAPDLDLDQHPDVDELLEVHGRHLALGDAAFDEVLDAAVRLHEQGVDQLCRRSCRGVRHCGEHERDPASQAPSRVTPSSSR